MKYKFILTSLMLLYLGTTTTLIQLQQQAIAKVAKENRIKLKVILEPELPPLGAASLYLPFEEVTVNNSLISNLRNTRLITKLHAPRAYFYQVNKLQSSYPLVIENAFQESSKGNFKSTDMQYNSTGQSPSRGKIVPPGIQSSLGTIWLSFWHGLDFIGSHDLPAEFVGQDVFALYDQIKMGTTVIVKP